MAESKEQEKSQIDVLTKPLKMYKIQGEDLEEFFTLMDAGGNGAYALGKYHLWKFIGSRFPDVSDGEWYLKQTDPFHVYIINGKPDISAVANDFSSMLARTILGRGEDQ